MRKGFYDYFDEALIEGNAKQIPIPCEAITHARS